MLIIVDDLEEAIRLSPALKRAGYQVTFSDSMPDAARRLNETGSAPRAVLSLREDWLSVLGDVAPEVRPSSAAASSPRLETIAPGVVFDPGRQVVIVDSNARSLTATETRLLRVLLDHPDRPLNRAQLLDWVWGFDYHAQNREVDVYIRYLRRKIEPEPTHPRIIVTVRGLGYMYRRERAR